MIISTKHSGTKLTNMALKKWKMTSINSKGKFLALTSTPVLTTWALVRLFLEFMQGVMKIDMNTLVIINVASKECFLPDRSRVPFEDQPNSSFFAKICDVLLLSAEFQTEPLATLFKLFHYQSYTSLWIEFVDICIHRYIAVQWPWTNKCIHAQYKLVHLNCTYLYPHLSPYTICTSAFWAHLKTHKRSRKYQMGWSKKGWIWYNGRINWIYVSKWGWMPVGKISKSLESAFSWTTSWFIAENSSSRD